MRVLPMTLVLAFVGLLVADLEPGAAPRAERTATTTAATTTGAVTPQVLRVAAASRTVEVAFVRGGRLVRVERELPRGAQPALHALRELAKGPTRAERARGLRTAFGPGLQPRFVRGQGDTFLVRVSPALLAPGTPQTVATRLAQIGATLAWLETPRRYAAISVDGRLAATVRLGARPAPQGFRDGEQGYAYSVRGIQLRLAALGYLDPGDVTGSFHSRTSHALLAFQGWEGLARTGTVTGQTQVALFKASPPRPAVRAAGRRLEIHRERGVLLMIRGGEVLRAIHTSTGRGGITPVGDFRVYRKERMSWSVPFQVWMPWAAYFVRGIATHEYHDVPAYPASRGCVRLPSGEAERVYRFVETGTPVRVV